MPGFPVKRYVRALRNRGPRAVLHDRYNSWVNNRLLRKVVYPKIGLLHRAKLQFENNKKNRALRHNSSQQPGTVYVVICVDTEGPSENYEHKDWSLLHSHLEELFDVDNRMKYKDSAGNPFAMSWFIVDWVNSPPGPKASAVGHHAVYDPYLKWLEKSAPRGFADELYWHYHHCFPGKLGSWNRTWSNHPDYNEIICKKIFERDYFPSVYRAGNTWEDADVSSWLERFVPFDYSNRGPWRSIHYDWLGAPTDWSIYHPSDDCPKKIGSQKRLMARSLDIEMNTFYDEEIESAFLDASLGYDRCLSFYVHDMRPMLDFVAGGLQRIQRISANFPEVQWLHSNALACMQKLANREPSTTFQGQGMITGRTIEVSFPEEIFGEPWLATLSLNGYERHDMSKSSDGSWQTVLPQDPLYYERISAAANNPAGQSSVIHLHDLGSQ